MTAPNSIPMLELIDWWEASRWSAQELCLATSEHLKSYAQDAVAKLSSNQLMLTKSTERDLLEDYIKQEIGGCQAELAQRLNVDLAPEPDGRTVSILPAFTGWSYWDLATILLGGSAPTAAVLAGGRAAAGVAATAGLAVLAAPITIAAGVAGLAWGAYSAADTKRTAYLETLLAGIDSALLAQDSDETSVLSRHYSHLDQILKHKSELGL